MNKFIYAKHDLSFLLSNIYIATMFLWSTHMKIKTDKYVKVGKGVFQ